MTKIISILTTILVFVVATIAFILSYDALRDVAMTYGVKPQLTLLWPLLIDFALIVFSLAVVHASLTHSPTWWPWSLVGLFTALTITFNLIHASNDLISRFVAVIPPVALVLSFESLMFMVRRGVKRIAVMSQLDDIERQVEVKTRQLATLERQIERQDATIQVETTTETTAPIVKATQVRVTKKEERQARLPQLVSEGVEIDDIAGMYDVTPRTIQRDLLELGISINGKH